MYEDFRTSEQLGNPDWWTDFLQSGSNIYQKYSELKNIENQRKAYEAYTVELNKARQAQDSAIAVQGEFMTKYGKYLPYIIVFSLLGTGVYIYVKKRRTN